VTGDATLHRVVLVTGTGTEVGKTVVVAALAAAQRAAGHRVALVKPVQTGLVTGEPGDVHEAGRLAGVEADDLHELVRLPDPLAPDTAARLRGLGLPAVADHAESVRALAASRDVVVVEGSGGLLVRLDLDGGNLADLALRLGGDADGSDAPGGEPPRPAAGVLVVVPAGLGALNLAALTVEALRARRLDVLGLVVGAWPARPGLAERCNLDDLPAVTGLPLLGVLPEGVGHLEPGAFRSDAVTWLAPRLGGVSADGRGAANHP